MSAPVKFVMVGTTHHTASVAQREQLSIETGQTESFYAGMAALANVRESFLLSTCNRLEVYACTERAEAIEAIARYLCEFNHLNHDAFESIRLQRFDLEAVTHLFEVASGINSQIIGETEILGQVKEAYTAATRHRAVGPVMNRLIQKSFQAAKWIRTYTAIGQGRISTATVAVDLATKIFGCLDRTRILVIGAGAIGEKTARALLSRGARAVTVANRTEAAASALATSIGAESAPIEVLDADLGAFDIVVTSTSSRDPILSSRQVERAMKRRALRPLFLIDLAVPRDIDPHAGALGNVYLYNIDDLSEITRANMAQRTAEVARCQAVLSERALRVWTSINPRETNTPSGIKARSTG